MTHSSGGACARRLGLVAAALAAMASPGAAVAAPEEIQVFTDELPERGEFGLELHLNHVPAGEGGIDYPGQAASAHRLRATPELSYGLGGGFQIGLLAPLATIDRRGHVDAGGAKAMARYIRPAGTARGWWIGANIEIGRAGRRLEPNPWNAEVTGIVGTRRGPWLIALNATAEIALSGRDRGPAEIDLAAKLTRRLSEGVAIGIESYNGAGDVRRPGRFGTSDQALFAVADAEIGGWELNFGVGRGYGANPDRWIVKSTIGVPIGRRR